MRGIGGFPGDGQTFLAADIGTTTRSVSSFFHSLRNPRNPRVRRKFLATRLFIPPSFLAANEANPRLHAVKWEERGEDDGRKAGEMVSMEERG